MSHSTYNYPIRMTLILALAVLVALVVQAQTKAAAPLTNGFELAWSTIDGGGAMFSAGGDYSLGGTIGQPDAGAMSASGYTLFGGFWGDEAAPYAVYLPIVIK
jgi:hypothetical protein